MAVPKGFKSESGYGTIKKFDGKTYHEIANIMTDNGFKMKHSYARTIYINSLKKVASELSSLYGLEYSEKDLLKIAVNADFQESVRDFMSNIEFDQKKSNNSKKGFDT